MKQINTFLLIYIFTMGVVGNQTSKTINPLNLLLPVSSQTKVEFVIQAYNGCYKFSSSDPDIISVTAIPSENYTQGCSNKAIARVEVSYPVRSIVWLIAEEESTGTILRCESRVAEINRIEILTRLRSIDVGVFESVEVAGFDVFGNSKLLR